MAASRDSLSADELYLSVLVVGEIRYGIERLRLRDHSRLTLFTGEARRLEPTGSSLLNPWD